LIGVGLLNKSEGDKMFLKMLDKQEKIEMIKILLEGLTDYERYEIFTDYCIYCGSVDPNCCCMRDE